MRRTGNLWPEVVSFSALLAAAQRASRGKRRSASVARFLERAEPEVLLLQRELESDTWRPGPSERFEIRDPKRRIITAVPFRDRVVHHALMAPLEPLFDRRMIADTYACRRGKGTHAALRRARQYARRHDYFLKLDVQSFFPSVRPQIVKATLRRVVKDRRVLALCDRILDGPSAQREPAPGLPIGSLTSQWFANLVLDPLDHFVKETLLVPGYLRYMDDMLLFAPDRRTLREAHRAVAAFLGEKLELHLKERATILAPVTEGIPFLGWRVFRGTVRLQAANLRRYRWRLRLRRWELATGRCDEATYRQAVASVYTHVSQGSTLGLRRRWCQDHGLDL